MSNDLTRDRLAEVITDPLAANGLDVEAIELTPAGKRRMLRVAVDRDGGVTLDDIAEATKEVSRLLDESDVMGEQSYTLEVTSPGTDRPLTLPRHWRRNTDRLVKVTRTDGTTLVGRIRSADDDAVDLEVAGAQQRVSYDAVAKAKVEIEFNRRPDPEAAGAGADDEEA